VKLRWGRQNLIGKNSKFFVYVGVVDRLGTWRLHFEFYYILYNFGGKLHQGVN
jgi:hypothetical protein